jgi:hypothetical protein
MPRASARKNQPVAVDAELVDAVTVAVPPGREVERTTVERFTAPLPTPAPPPPAPSPVAVEDTDDPDDDNLVFEYELSPFEEFREQVRRRPEQRAIILVTRLADGIALRGMFAVPCHGQLNCEPIPYDESMLSPDDFYPIVREQNGGGRYRFQIRAGAGFGEAWEETISDAPGARATQQQQQQAAAEQQQQPTQTAPAAPATPVDQFEQMIEALEKQNRFRNALLAGSQPAPVAPASVPAEPAPPTDPMLRLIDAAKDNPTLIEKILAHYLDNETGSAGRSSVIHDIASYLPLLGPVIESIAPTIKDIFNPAPTPQTRALQNSQRAPQRPLTEQEELNRIIHLIVSEMKTSRRPGRAADEIEQFCLKAPSMVPYFKDFFEKPELLMLRQLEERTGEDLVQFSHSIGWLEELKDTMNLFDDDDAVDAQDDSIDADEQEHEIFVRPDEPASSSGGDADDGTLM